LLRTPRRKTQRPNAGFTLVEQLVAIAVMALTLLAIARLVGSTSRGARQIEQRVSLIQAANSMLFDMPARAGPTAPESDGEAWGHRWRRRVSPAEVGPDPAAENNRWTPMHVDLLVQGASGSAIRLHTIRLQRTPAR